MDFKTIQSIIIYRERKNSYSSLSALKRLSKQSQVLPELRVDPKHETGRSFKKKQEKRRQSDLVLPKLTDIVHCEEEEEENQDGDNGVHQKWNKSLSQDLNNKNENKDGERKTANERIKRRRNALTNSKRIRFSL